MNFSFYQASLIAQLVRNLSAMQETQVCSWVGKITWRRDRLLTPVFLGFACGSAGKESPCNAEDLGLIPEWEDPLEKGKATHSSILAKNTKNSKDCIVHGVTKSQTRLSDFHLTFHFISCPVQRFTF